MYLKDSLFVHLPLLLHGIPVEPLYVVERLLAGLLNHAQDRVLALVPQKSADVRVSDGIQGRERRGTSRMVQALVAAQRLQRLLNPGQIHALGAEENSGFHLLATQIARRLTET